MRKNSEFYGLLKNDRLLFLSGVPLSYLKKPAIPSEFNFTITSMANKARTVTITAQRQRDVLLEMLENIVGLGESGLYGIGSYPTEAAGYGLGTLLTREYFNAAFNDQKIAEIKWIDLGRPDWDFLKSNEPCDLCVIHGLSINSDDKRLTLARDFIHRTEFCTTIVIANTDNILKYVVEKVGASPDIVWQLSKTVHEVYL